MTKLNKIYHITHGVDMDGITCTALIERLNTTVYERVLVRLYSRLYDELRLAQQKLDAGYIVVISDLCFYEEKVINYMKSLLKKYENQIIILDHHVETIQLLKEMKDSINLGYSQLTIEYANPVNSAAYITYRFVQEVDSSIHISEELIRAVSDWDTFNICEDVTLPYVLQIYFMTHGTKKFISLLQSKHWEKQLKTPLFCSKKILLEDSLSLVLQSCHTTELDSCKIIQFPELHRLNKHIRETYNLDDLCELICYKYSCKGITSVAIVGNTTCIYKGKGKDISKLLELFKIPYGKDRNVVSYLTSNIFRAQIEYFMQ